MKNRVLRVRRGFRLVTEILPALRRISSRQLKWEVLQEDGLVTVGANTYGVPDVYYWDDKTKLSIGKFCSIAEGVVFLLGGEHRIDWITTFPFNVKYAEWPEAGNIQGHPSSKGDILVANDVWIGHGATITSGVTIGNGAVIGAGSVVTKNVDDYEIVAGNPARHIRYRFDEKTRQQLLHMAWWNWPTERIRSEIPGLMAVPTIAE